MVRILVVEDESDIAELVQYNLQAAGMLVTLTPDGRPALEELQNEDFDLLVLDLMLPTLSGLEVCKAIRSNPNFQQLPILIVSARCDEATRILALAVGASDYLVKPFSPRELVERVRALLPRTAEPVASAGTR